MRFNERGGRLLVASLIGFLFLLPHLIRMWEIGSVRGYTPFSAESRSSMVWDETFLYATQVNSGLEHGFAANDTDTWEHRGDQFPYSILPAAVEAGVARAVGGLGMAQVVCEFVFPTLTAWLLIGVFGRAGGGLALSGLLTVGVLAAGFSPQTVVLGDLAFLRHGWHGGTWDLMQVARNPNPNMSFALFMGAALCMGEAIRRRSAGIAVVSGALGGLLFYCYTYYAIAWTAAVFLVWLLVMVRKSGEARTVAWSVMTTALVEAPFLYWKHVAGLKGGYLRRTARLGMTYGHMPTRYGLALSAECGAGLVALVALWVWLRQRVGDGRGRWEYSSELVPVLACCVLGGVAGMNMQVLTGFNVQPEVHFSHMVLRPVLVVLMGVLVALVYPEGRRGRLVATAGLGLAVVACGVSQVEAAVGTVGVHRVSASDRMLFGWLEGSSAVDDVVATTDLRLSTVIPLYTHDRVLLANGSRTSASDEELIERYLLASALVGTPMDVVRDRLRQGGLSGRLPSATDTYVLFEISPYVDGGNRRISDEALPGVLGEYVGMDVAEVLGRYRVNYVWVTGENAPAAVTGVRWVEVLRTGEGGLWHLERG